MTGVLLGPFSERYREAARWWRRHADESRNPSEPLWYAENQERLADDMDRRPAHYTRKPAGLTDWEWMQR